MEITKKQWYAFIIALVMAFLGWLEFVYLFDKEENDKITKKQWYALGIGIFMSVLGWTQMIFLLK